MIERARSSRKAPASGHASVPEAPREAMMIRSIRWRPRPKCFKRNSRSLSQRAIDAQVAGLGDGTIVTVLPRLGVASSQKHGSVSNEPRENERGCGTVSWHAVDEQLAAVEGDDRLHNRQPQSGALGAVGPGGVDAIKAIAQFG